MTIKVKPFTQPNIIPIFENRNPTDDDSGYPVLTIWLNQLTSKTYQLVDKSSGASWVRFSGGSDSGSKLVSWDDTENYVVNDIVNEGGALYVCILDSINDQPSISPLYWDTYIQSIGMTTITNPAINAAVTTALIDDYSGVIITLSASGNNQTLQPPTDVTPGKKYTVIVYASDGVSTIEVNTITLSNNEAQDFIWDGSLWNSVSGVDADDIDFTPSGSVTSTNVQAAIEEVSAVASAGPVTQVVTGNHVILITELGSSIRAKSAGDIIFTFEGLGSAQDGYKITISKINTGKVTITPPAGKYIDDKAIGVATYNNTSETYSTITLEYVHEIETLVIIGARGSWF